MRSFILCITNHKFDEHVNNHQIDFCRKVAKKQGNIIVVEDVKKIGETIDMYDDIVERMSGSLSSNNERFCNEFAGIVDGLMKRRKR